MKVEGTIMSSIYVTVNHLNISLWFTFYTSSYIDIRMTFISFHFRTLPSILLFFLFSFSFSFNWTFSLQSWNNENVTEFLFLFFNEQRIYFVSFFFCTFKRMSTNHKTHSTFMLMLMLMFISTYIMIIMFFE